MQFDSGIAAGQESNEAPGGHQILVGRRVTRASPQPLTPILTSTRKKWLIRYHRRGDPYLKIYE
ncbi:hypothetical protein GCM10022226_59970 [Sphaerisporangium flaviroseum]|uniref:Integrase n=1 Tax=Sphaerisporangium flaviroseum TaxID=509199 RepID=A0ABP7IZN8_9ACTN